MKANFELDPVQWSRLRHLLDGALGLAPAERASWVERLAPEDEDLKPRLRALLAHAAGDSSPLDTLPQVETAQFLAERAQRGDAALAPGAAVGPYRLVRPIGEGGMGAVYLAERTDMLQKRQVALKLPRLLTQRAALAERLAREREILAALNHPNIARLYDAGLTADGQPYLALEYVEGERIDAYCARKALDVTARLRLFVQVARAVAHAHANLVVHRDLKPSNILVTEAGEVKLLDFGIAKLLADGRAQETELTQLAGRALTPDYAAPEQILGQPLGTAADVYALGVVLFELLTGQRPYKLKRDSRAALEEAIVAAEPARPSAAANEPKLKKRLRGDLDTIVLKALKKAPGERYPTVLALAEDIERHLAQRPVRAQPDSRWYRARKFVARNTVAVGAAASVLAAVLAGAGVSLWQMQVARGEQKRAEEVKNFIAALFRDANPYLGGGRKMTVDELLAKARPRIDAEFAGRPAIRAELLVIIGTSLSSLGEERAAQPILEEAAAVAERTLGRRHVLTLNARSLLLGLKRRSDRSGAIAEQFDALIADMRANGNVAPEYFANTLAQRAHAALDLGQPEAAVRFAEDALRVATERLGPHLEQTLSIATLLAFAHQRARDWDQALAAAQRVVHLVFDVRKLPETHPSAVDARIMHGMALADTGRTQEGIDEIARGVANSLQERRESDPAVASFRGHLARYQLRAGLIREAIENHRAAVAAFRESAPATRMLPAALLNLGAAQIAARRPERAIEPLESAHRHFAGTSDVAAVGSQVQLAIALAMNARGVEAERLLEGAADPSATWAALFGRGLMLRYAGRPAEALALQERALTKTDDTPPRRRDKGRTLVELGLNRLDLGQHDEAARTLRLASAVLAAAELRASPDFVDSLVGLGRAQLALGDSAGALAPLQQADAFWRDFDSDNRWAGEAAFWLARCYEGLDRDAEAKQAYARAAKILARSPLPADAKLLNLARR